MVPFSVGNPLRKHTFERAGKSRKAHLFRSGREVFQNSDFFLHEVLLYFNRLV